MDGSERLAKLPDFDARGFGLGATPFGTDARDLEIASFFEVSSVIKSFVPPQADLSDGVCLVYNQGALPACVTYSIAGMQSLFRSIDDNCCLNFDAEEAYWINGGDGSHGVNIRATLKWSQRIGMKTVGSDERYRTGSYAFADPRTDAGVRAIKAALFTRRPCILAMLLPSDFFSGDSNGELVTKGYHQVCVTGYTEDRVKYVNSFGAEFGNKGFGSVPWSYLRKPEQSFGQVWVRAFTVAEYFDGECETGRN